jgi:ABC-type Fe3+/spermidine/putrescine transport system ATPase subunit
MQRLPRAEIERRVDEMLALIGLPGYQQRTIFELSGGERQRVALARSLAPQPRLLMLDEPLGALDRTLRERLTDDLRTIIKSVGLTSLYVTHDQVEAFAVADRVLVMDRGQIVQSGTPAEVYRQPASVFVARFLGLNNVLEGERLPAPPDRSGLLIQTALGPLRVAADRDSADRPIVLIRPEAAAPADGRRENVIAGTVTRSTFRGSSQRLTLRHASGVELELDMSGADCREGEQIELALRSDQIRIIDQG